MLLLVLVVLFVVLPITEIYMIIQVGQALGAPLTILVLILDSIIGSLLLRHEGRNVWRHFQAEVAASKLPTKQILDGLLVAVGGTLLLTPGFITDIFGILMILPPTRALWRKGIIRYLNARVVTTGFTYDYGSSKQNYDVDGTASEIKQSREIDPESPGMN